MIRGMMVAAAALALAAFTGAPATAAMKLTSPDVKANGKIADEQVFNGFGCTGQNISPALAWSGTPPKGTKSFALTVYDPDAPTGSGFWHWVVINIPATATSLPKNAGDPKGSAAPAGALQTRTDFGVPGWGGPCPPKGDKPHRYIFTLYAVDTDKLPVPGQDVSAAVVGFMLHFHKVGKPVTLTAKYGR
jgi:Raf kinase inhibitor-like YbhB/YbcL family protein